MSGIRMIALDLDGTLLGPDGKASQRNLQALRAAEDAGLLVVIATGRRHSYALRVLTESGLRSDTLLVSSNGAVIREFGSRLLERTHMPLETALWFCSYMQQFRNALVITFDKVAPSGEDICGSLVVEELDELHGSIGQWMKLNEPYIRHVQPIEEALLEEAPIQMMICGTVERMRLAEEHLLEDSRVVPVGDPRQDGIISLNRTAYPARDLSILDIMPAGCSKGDALLRIASARGIPATEIMAIGDNWNDLSMLQVVGRPVLMANAPSDLAELAVQRGWHTTAGNDADGVALAIEATFPSLFPTAEDLLQPL